MTTTHLPRTMHQFQMQHGNRTLTVGVADVTYNGRRNLTVWQEGKARNGRGTFHQFRVQDDGTVFTDDRTPKFARSAARYYLTQGA